MSHYFTNSPELGHAETQIEAELFGHSFAFITDAGVFSKAHLDPGSELLIRSVPTLCGPVADMGCGWGPVGVILAWKNPDARFAMVDINARAAALAERNICLNGIVNARALEGDGLAPVPGPLNAVVSNPPIRIGKQALYCLFAQAHEKLRPGGVLYIVIRKQQGAPSAKDYLAGLFGSCELIARQSGYWILAATKTGAPEDGL